MCLPQYCNFLECQCHISTSLMSRKCLAQCFAQNRYSRHILWIDLWWHSGTGLLWLDRDHVEMVRSEDPYTPEPWNFKKLSEITKDQEKVGGHWMGDAKSQDGRAILRRAFDFLLSRVVLGASVLCGSPQRPPACTSSRWFAWKQFDHRNGKIQANNRGLFGTIQSHNRMPFNMSVYCFCPIWKTMDSHREDSWMTTSKHIKT